MKTSRLLIALFAALLAGSALAETPGITRGNFLRKPEYQTYATTSLFVDPTGNDANACTATGTDACLTLGGAIAKLPRFIRNNVTITLAAGTYTGSTTIADLHFNGSSSLLTITGPALTAVTPATGTSTGTLTGYTATTATVPGVLTDSTQTWTTNDLRGRFVRITSGGANNQLRAISGNTATGLEIAGYYSSNPAAGATYEIVTPAAIIGQVIIGGNVDTGTATANLISLTQLDLTNSTAGTTLSVGGKFQYTVRTPDSRVLATGTGSAVAGSVFVGGGSGNASVTMANSGSGWAIFGSSTIEPQNWGNAAAAQAPFVYSASGNAIRQSSRNLQVAINAPSGIYETGSASAAVISIGSGTYFAGSTTNTSTQVGRFIRCPSGSTGQGILVGDSPRAEYHQFPVNVFTVTNCAVGMSFNGLIAVPSFGTLSFVSTTTAIQLTKGATMNLQAAPTFSGVTNEIQVDGTNYTYAFINALSPKFLTNAATKSSIGIY